MRIQLCMCNSAFYLAVFSFSHFIHFQFWLKQLLLLSLKLTINSIRLNFTCVFVTIQLLPIPSCPTPTWNWRKGNVLQRATYCTLVQESVVELHKLLLGLFGTEVPEEVSMEVTQLRGERRTEDRSMNFNRLKSFIKRGNSSQGDDIKWGERFH